jgi:hypothetical protein
VDWANGGLVRKARPRSLVDSRFRKEAVLTVIHFPNRREDVIPPEPGGTANPTEFGV